MGTGDKMQTRMRSQIVLLGVAFGLLVIAQFNFELAVLLLVLFALWWWWNQREAQDADAAATQATQSVATAEAQVQESIDKTASVIATEDAFNEMPEAQDAPSGDAAPDDAPAREDDPDDPPATVVDSAVADAAEVAGAAVTEEGEPSEDSAEADAPTPPITDEAQAVADEDDDLLRIEGIGPYYRDLLLQVGLNTYAKLAAMSAEAIETVIVNAGGRRTASISTWPQQAALAAKGDWEALDELQAGLSGGRRDA